MTSVLSAVSSTISERLRLNRWFRANAAAKNGVPWTEDSEGVTVQHYHHGLEPQPVSSEPPVPSPSAETPPIGPPSSAPISSSTPPWVVPLVSTLLALLLGGAGGWWLSSNSDQPPAPEPDQSSLFQDLEDRGFHLPE